MRLRLAALALLACALGAGAQAGQFQQEPPWFEVALPFSPYELTGGKIRVLADASERAVALARIDGARANFILLSNTAPHWQMSVGIAANGFPTYNGVGEMKQTWLANGAWEWTSQLGSTFNDRYAYRGLYATDPQAPVPMAIEMARELIFWPLAYATDARLSLREAHVIWDGKPATCELTAPAQADEPPNHRGWNENEFCMDDASGLLVMMSQAVGAYAVYDYQRALRFPGYVLPRKITWTSASATLTLTLNSLDGADTVDPASIRPTPAMTSQGRSWEMAMPPLPVMRWQAGATSPQPEAAVIEATVSPAGRVEEVLLVAPAADPGFTQLALNNITHGRFGPANGQRQWFFVVTTPPPAATPSGAGGY